MGLNPNQKELLKRSRATGVASPLCRSVVEAFQKWQQHSGAEWTVDRFKAIKLDVIRAHAGMELVAVWFSKRNHKPAGLYGRIIRYSMKSEEHFHRSIQLLQIYTTLFSDKVTQKQECKFLSGVLADPPCAEILAKYCKVITQGIAVAGMEGKFRVSEKPQPLVFMPSSPNKRAPVPWKLGTVPEVEGVLDSMSFLFGNWIGRNLVSKFSTTFESLFAPWKLSSDVYYQRYMDPHPHETFLTRHEVPRLVKDHLILGNIGLIQEAGFKLRAVANCARVYQRALQPLGDKLYSIVANLPWDCTFNQMKCIPSITKRLSTAGLSYSVDLSGATDYFPLALQMHAIRSILIDDNRQIDLLQDLLTYGEWYYKPQNKLIRWRRGQPLGMYPSFGMFTLTHGLLLLGLCAQLGIRKYHEQFFVLGDDVVILNTRLAELYLAAMNELGCPVSLSKTLVSNSCCEFAGKVITANRVIPQLKWRIPSDDSFIDIARLLGPRSLPLFRPRQRKIINWLADVPDVIGGLGWNPKGDPLQDRILRHLEFLDATDEENSLMTSQRRVVANNLYHSSLPMCEGSVLDKDILLDLDLRSGFLTAKYLGIDFVKIKDALSKNLGGILPKGMLPPDVVWTIRRTTVLTRYERKRRSIALDT